MLIHVRIQYIHTKQTFVDVYRKSAVSAHILQYINVAPSKKLETECIHVICMLEEEQNRMKNIVNSYTKEEKRIK